MSDYSQSVKYFVAVGTFLVFGLVPTPASAVADIKDGAFSNDQNACYSGNANVSVVSLPDSGPLVLCLASCLQTSWCAAARYTPATGACDLASVQLCSPEQTPPNQRYYRRCTSLTTPSSTTVTTPVASAPVTTTAATTMTTTPAASSISFSSSDLVSSQTFYGCQDAMSKGVTASGVLYINPTGADRFPVWCNFTSGVASLTIHRRFSGELDFVSKTWAEYENGFGNLSGEHWLGLRRIAQLTKTGAKLLVYLVGNKDRVLTCTYNNITVLPASSNYKLLLTGYEAGSTPPTTADNQMTPYINRPFSTRDVDNDLLSTGNCATTRGGWWWDDCNPTLININGDYSKTTASCVFWQGSPDTQGCQLQYISWRIVF